MEYFDRETLNEKKIEWLNILHENELSDNSIKRYTINITFFINYISEKKIDKETIKSFKDTLISDRKYLSNTANNYLITANNFLRFLDLENLCVKLFKIQRKDHLDDPITYTDYHRLLRCALAKDKENIYLLIRILGETGIRVGELKYLTGNTLCTQVKEEMFDWEKVRKSIKSKSEKCCKCDMNDLCEGVWCEYAENFGVSELTPISLPTSAKEKIISKLKAGF